MKNVNKKIKLREHVLANVLHPNIVIQTINDLHLASDFGKPDLHGQTLRVLWSDQEDEPNREKKSCDQG